MRTPPNAWLAAVALFPAAVAACSNEASSAATILDTDECFGFTAQGPALDDDDLIEDAVDEWENDTEADDFDGIGLDDEAEVCVVYAGPDASDHPSVALMSDDVSATGGDPAVAVYEVLDPQNDDPVGGVQYVANAGEDAPLIGVADGLWLLADHIDGVDVHVGTVAGPAHLERVEGPLVEATALASEEYAHMLAVVEHGDQRYAASMGWDAGERFPVVIRLGDSDADFDSLLESPAGVPLLATAVRDAHREVPGHLTTLDVVGTTEIPGVGRVLASAAVEFPNSRIVTPMIHVPSGVDVAGVSYLVRNARPGWAVGVWLATSGDSGPVPASYLAVAAPPSATPDAAVEITLAVGSRQQTEPGPLVWAEAPPAGDDGSIAGAIIATADGDVVPIITVNGELHY